MSSKLPTGNSVSVCLPVYNGTAFLKSAFDCLAAQTFKDFEVVIVDDGSTDGSAEMARSLLRQHGITGSVYRIANRGAEQARDFACNLATTNILATYDCDDVWVPTYLEEMVGVLNTHPEVGLVYCDFIEEWTETGVTNLKSDATSWIDLKQATNDGDVFYFNGGAFFSMLLQGQVLFPPCTVFRKQTYIEAGQYARDLPRLRVSLDWSFGLRVSRVTGIAFLHKPLLRKVLHGGNVSGDPLRTAICDVTVLDGILEDDTLTERERENARGRACGCAFLAAYASWMRGQPSQARLWALRALRYQWNRSAAILVAKTFVPMEWVNRLRTDQSLQVHGLRRRSAAALTRDDG